MGELEQEAAETGLSSRTIGTGNLFHLSKIKLLFPALNYLTMAYRITEIEGIGSMAHTYHGN